MLILLLVATVVNSVTLTVLPQCAEFAAICDADERLGADFLPLDPPVFPCATLEAATHKCVVDGQTEILTANPEATFTPTQVGQAYSDCAFMMGKALGASLSITKVPYQLSSLLECQCENLADAVAYMAAVGTPIPFVQLEQPSCNWYKVSGVWDALDVCLQNPDCVEDWEGVITETKKLDVKWDDTYSPLLTTAGTFDFPDITQDSKNFCLILFGVMAYANTDLLNYGAAMFALQVENGGEIVEECNALMSKRIVGLVAGIAAGVFVLTLIGGCAYTYFCGAKKD